MDEWVQLISNVGFPIFCTIMLGYLNLKLLDNLKEQTNKFTSAINQFNINLQKLTSKLDIEYDKEDN